MQELGPSEQTSKQKKDSLAHYIYNSLRKTQQPSDGVLLLMSSAISLSEILAEYLININDRELYLFVGLDDIEIAEVNRVANERRRELVLLGKNVSGIELVKITPLKKEKRREAYIKGGFYTLTAGIVILDLLSGSELPSQLITKIFFRDCEHVKTYKDQLAWINHLTRVEGDSPFSINNHTQTIVISQRVSRLTVTTFQNLYQLFGLKKVVMWPFGHERILKQIQQRTLAFEELEESITMSQNDRAIQQCLDELLKYCDSCMSREERKSQQSGRLHYFYRLFSREKDQVVADEPSSHPLITNLRQVRGLMFRLSNYTAVETWRTLNTYLTAKKESAQFWDTSNQQAQGRIEQLKKRLRSGIFEFRPIQEKRDVNLDFLTLENTQSQADSVPQSFSVSYSLKFLYPTTKKISVLTSILQTISKEPSQRIWVFAHSNRLVNYLQQEIHSYISNQQMLHRLRSALALLEEQRVDRRVELRHLLVLKKPNSKQLFLINSCILLQELYQELVLFFTHYDEFLSNNLSNQEQPSRYPTLVENLERLQKERFQSIQFRYIQVLPLLQGVRDHPQYLHYTDTIELNCAGSSVVVCNPDRPETVAEFLRLHQPTHAVMYTPNLTVLRCLYLQAEKIKQVFTINCRKSLEEAVYIHEATQEDSAFWQIGKARANLGNYIDNFKSRIAEIKERTMKSRSMLRYVNWLYMQGTNEPAAPLLPSIKKDFIIVDKRQYNSQLPSQLYFAGFTTVPMMLETGDYILSNDRAVERKAISTRDIHESLRSGRLRDQLKRMSSLFRQPYLLIEGSTDEEFSMKKLNVSWNYVTKEQYQLNVRRGVIELLKKFPTVRVIWSHNPQETVQLFLSLKEGQIEPDLELFRQSRSLAEEDLSELAATSKVKRVIDE